MVLEFIVACWLGYCVLCVACETFDKWRERRHRKAFDHMMATNPPPTAAELWGDVAPMRKPVEPRS